MKSWTHFVMLGSFWALALVLVVWWVAMLMFRRGQGGQTQRTRVQNMSAREFQSYLIRLFAGLGYERVKISHTGRYGGSLVLSRRGERLLVSARTWWQTFPAKAIEEVALASRHHGCRRTLVVTGQALAHAAEQMAAAQNVEVWERQELVNHLLRLQEHGRTQAGSMPSLPRRTAKGTW